MEDRDLASCLNTPDGLTFKEAQNFAGLKVELLRERSLAEIDDAMDGFAGYLRLLREGTPPSSVEGEMQRQACAILSLAGTFGYEALGKAAYSLCVLLDERGARGQWDRIAVDVHFDALRVLRHPDKVSPAMQEHLLEGLRLVVNHAAAGADK